MAQPVELFVAGPVHEPAGAVAAVERAGEPAPGVDPAPGVEMVPTAVGDVPGREA